MKIVNDGLRILRFLTDEFKIAFTIVRNCNFLTADAVLLIYKKKIQFTFTSSYSLFHPVLLSRLISCLLALSTNFSKCNRRTKTYLAFNELTYASSRYRTNF